MVLKLSNTVLSFDISMVLKKSNTPYNHGSQFFQKRKIIPARKITCSSYLNHFQDPLDLGPIACFFFFVFFWVLFCFFFLGTKGKKHSNAEQNKETSLRYCGNSF
jgi:preprotein translocase subunit SecY